MRQHPRQVIIKQEQCFVNSSHIDYRRGRGYNIQDAKNVIVAARVPQKEKEWKTVKTGKQGL